LHQFNTGNTLELGNGLLEYQVVENL